MVVKRKISLPEGLPKNLDTIMTTLKVDFRGKNLYSVYVSVRSAKGGVQLRKSNQLSCSQIMVMFNDRKCLINMDINQYVNKE